MKISIIIPTYNRATYLQEAILSVIKQSYSNWEIIIIDDNSTDNTLEIINKFYKSDKRIRFITKPIDIKKGPCSSRNLGIEESTGDYIIFLDSDDLLMPYCLEERIEQIKKSPDFNCWIFNGAGFKNDNFSSLLLWNVANDQNDLKRFFSLDVPWQTTGPIWLKKNLIDFGIKWDSATEPWDDVDFHISVLLNKEIKYKVFWQSQYDYLFRISSNDSISQTDYFNPKKVEARFYFFLKYYQLLQEEQLVLLRPILLTVLQACVVMKLYFKAYYFINLASKKNIINSTEKLFIRNQVFKKQLLRNRLFKFPTLKIKNALIPIESNTLKTQVTITGK